MNGSLLVLTGFNRQLDIQQKRERERLIFLSLTNGA